MEPGKKSSRYRKSRSGYSRRSNTLNFLKRIKVDTVANSKSDQEWRKPKEISKERKLLSNNEELAKALARSKMRERQSKDEILKLQEEKLDLIEHLQCLKEEQESYLSAAVESYQMNVIKKLVDVTNVITDLTVVCMKSFGKQTENAKEVPEQKPNKTNSDNENLHERGGMFKEDCPTKKTGDSPTEATKVAVYLDDKNINLRKRSKNKEGETSKEINVSEPNAVAMEISCCNSDYPVNVLLLNRTKNREGDNHVMNVDDLKQSLPKQESKSSKNEAEKIAIERSTDIFSQQSGFQIISSEIKNANEEDDIMFIADEDSTKVLKYTEELAREEKESNYQEKFGNGCSNEENRQIVQDCISTDSGCLEIKFQSVKEKVSEINRNESSCCLNASWRKTEEIIECTKVNQHRTKRKQRNSHAKENECKRQRRGKRAPKVFMNIHPMCTDDKENIMPNFIQEIKQFNKDLDEKKQKIFCSPFKNVAKMVLSPLHTKSPIFMRTSRLKRKVSYMEPSLSKKLRRGDPCTDSTLYSSPHIGPKKRPKKKQNSRRPLQEIENSITEEE